MDKELLESNARKLVSPGRGILAADESTGTMTKRLESVGMESTEDARRRFCANLFATDGCESAISGVILYDETLRQSVDDGRTIPEFLTSKNIIPGIKVDTGAKELAGSPGEMVTEGLDGLRDRCAEYFSLGARFAKWRAVIKIDDGQPSEACVSANAHALARYSAICQEQGLVPIIEPEVLMDGSHSSQVCYDVTSKVLKATFDECARQGVHFPGALLKPNMIIAGKDSGEGADRHNVAQMTLDCLSESIPSDIPGVVFLSGGQSDEDATAHLNIMNDISSGSAPWQLSYSYGRALQAAALKAWAAGTPADSQAAFSHRAKMNSLARTGDWSEELEG